MPQTTGILLTWTTYGTWLLGDARGWVDQGIVFPAAPHIQLADRRRLKHPPFLFPPMQQSAAVEFCTSAMKSLGTAPLALHIGSWHVHIVIPYLHVPLPAIVKTVKDGIRRGLDHRRPIWTDGYDRRFCFDYASLQNRVDYVRRHNLRGVQDGPGV